MNDLNLLKKAAASVGNTPAGYKSELAEVIVESIQPNQLTLDTFSIFMPTRNLNPGDSLEVQVKNVDFPVRKMVPGTNHLSSTPIPPGRVLMHALDALIAKAGHDLRSIQRGEPYSVAELRANLKQSLVNGIISRIWELLTTVWNETTNPEFYEDLSTTKLTKAGLDAMMETVFDYAGGVRVIVGTRKALLPLYSFAGYQVVTFPDNSNNSAKYGVVGILSRLEEFSQTGRISTYNGIPVLELPQRRVRTMPNYSTKLMDDRFVLVIGENAGDVVLYDEPQSQEHIDTSVEPAYYYLSIWQQYGLMVTRPDAVGVLKVGN